MKHSIDNTLDTIDVKRLLKRFRKIKENPKKLEEAELLYMILLKIRGTGAKILIRNSYVADYIEILTKKDLKRWSIEELKEMEWGEDDVWDSVYDAFRCDSIAIDINGVTYRAY